MNWLTFTFLRREARRDATLGVHSAEEYVLRHCGPRPADLDPVANFEHGDVAAKLARSTEIAEWSDDLRRAESEASHHPATTGLTLGIVFCFLVEILGGVLIMRALGVAEGERLPLGIALGLALIGITAVASSRAAAPLAGATGAPPAPKQRATVFILAVYSALVVPLAIVRLRLSSEDGGGFEALPETIIMIATTVGPAWLAEYFLRKRRPSALLAGQIKRLRRNIRGAERERDASRAYTVALSRRQAAWDTEAARLRAAYESEHRRARAEVGRSAPTDHPIERM